MSGGLLAIVFDDGPVTDVQVVQPVLASTGVRATFAVVTDRIDEDGALDRDALAALGRDGHGVVAHGRHHRMLGPHHLVADVSPGDRCVYLDGHVCPGAQAGIRAGDAYELTDGRRRTTVDIASTGADERGTYVELAAPVGSAWTTEAVCRPTRAVLEDEIAGARTDLEAVGIEPAAFVFPYDVVDPRAWSIVRREYDVVANASVSQLPNPRRTTVRDLRRWYLETDRCSRPELRDYVDAVAQRDAVGVLAGRSDCGTLPTGRIRYAIRAARERGVAFTTLDRLASAPRMRGT